MPLIIDKNLTNGGLPVRSLREYLSSARTLVIPPWQREYSWSTGEDEQIDTLLKDLKKFVENKESSEYLIGSVVMCKLPGDENRPLLIDGQQRTITLTLLLMCIRKFLKSQNLIDGLNTADTTLDSDITRCLDENPYGSMRAKIAMKQSSADSTLEAIYEWSQKVGKYSKDDLANLEVKNSTQENLIDAVEFIYKKISGFQKKEKGLVREIEGDWVSKDQIKYAVKKLLDGVKIIEISVDNKRESISVFDHINNRGLALNPADLVKNLMFEKVSDKDFPTISERWTEMCELLLLNKKSRLQDPRYLLRALSHVEYGAHEGYDSLDVFWSEQFEKVEKGGTSPLEFSSKLPVYAKTLKALVAREQNYRGGLSSIYLSGELGSVQHYSVLLAGQHLSKDDSFHFLCEQVNIRTLAYMFGEERTQSFDGMIPKWAHKVHQLKSDASIDELKNIYKEFKPSESLMRDLKDRMAEWNYLVASQKRKIRSMLGLLSTELNEACKQRVTIEGVMRTRKLKNHSEPFHIDHIHPQSKSKSESVYQTIGNLTLLEPPANLAALDTAPSNKKKYYQECNLVLTKTLNGFDLSIPNQAKVLQELLGDKDTKQTPWDLDNWGPESIGERVNFLYSYFVKISERYWK